MFGTGPQDERDKLIRLSVAARPVNQMEHELTFRMTEELPTTVMPFIEDGELDNADEFERAYGRKLSLSEAMVIGYLAEEPTIEKYRRQICTARELGPKATLADYLIACELQGIPPILKETTK